MPGMNPFADGVNPHHDLCTEVANMTHGHIGFGCYDALHSNDDGDLAAAGDKNTNLYDEDYVLEFDDWANRDRDEDDSGGDGGEGVGEGVGLKYYICFRADHPTFDLLLASTPARSNCCVRSEVLAIRYHRGVKRLQAEDRKHQQFFDGIRVR